MQNETVYGIPFVKGDPRAGRPKGVRNKLTLQQRAFAEMVLGKPGTPEFAEFVQSQRKQLLAGIMPPAILQTILYYFTGKPVERVEVKDTTNDLDTLSTDQLRERALALAHSITAQPEDVTTRTNEHHDENIH